MSETRAAALSALGCFLWSCMAILPPVALAIGWIGWSLRIGALAALATFAVLLLIGGVCFAFGATSWPFVFLPFLAACGYSLLPDALPIPISNVAAVASGTILTMILILRKMHTVPMGVVMPFLVAAAYTLVGKIIPGPVDELFVYAITGWKAYGAARTMESSRTPGKQLP